MRQSVDTSRQNVDISRQSVDTSHALINDPAIIMGDESTGNLNTATRRLCLIFFRELAKERNQTIIAVTHDDDFAKNCDRIIKPKFRIRTLLQVPTTSNTNI